jgi:cold shock protein
MGAVVAVVLLLEWARTSHPCREGMECNQMTGSVKKVVPERGFGFIAAEDGTEYFFHRSGVDDSLNFDSLSVGEPVSFSVEDSQRGPRAHNVRPV